MRRLLFAVLFLAGCQPNDGRTQNPPPSRPDSALAGAEGATDSAVANALLEAADAGRIQGDSTAPVWIVEISDFQCPFCKQFHDETYPALVRDYVRAGVVRMAYVNLPLSIHQHAMPAAEVAMCSSAQGRFWPVHDALFDTQETWARMDDPAAFFDSLAVAHGADGPNLRACLESQTIRRLIGADVARAASAGIRSTPVFFVGTERIQGAAPLEEFRAAIARAVVAASAKTPTPQPDE